MAKKATKKTAVNKPTAKPIPKQKGRPSKFSDTYTPQVEKLCKLGATDKEIADFFDVDVATINRWKIDHTNFCESIKRGKILADANVAHSLYHKATGYEHPDVDIKMYEGEIIETRLVKHYPPDTTAAIFWLKNRQKKSWRDKQEIGFTDNEGEDIMIGYGKEED